MGVSGPVLFLEKGTKVQPKIRGNNLVTKYGLLERSGVITSKAAYMDDDNWAQVVKVVARGIRKMSLINIYLFCSVLFSTYTTLHICPSKLYAGDSRLPKMVGLPHI